jgi:type VI secretion system protein ImpK
MSTTLQYAPPAIASESARRGELALALQEAFTVAVRLRAGRQVATDAASFRVHIKQLLAGADQRARAAGYDGETVKLAVYAYIALLDESVLASSNPIFADWSRQPLQEEVFGEHMAGENFFRTLQELLARQDSEGLADLLEVYQLCLLIGFHGRYGHGDAGAVPAVSAAVRTKLARIRSGDPGVAELAPDWRIPANEQLMRGRDAWTRRLLMITAALAGATIVLFLLYELLLRSGITRLRNLVG